MTKYLDFTDEKREKGYIEFSPHRNNFKKHIGKSICYVTARDVDDARGYVFVKYGTIYSLRYSTMYLDGGNREIDMRDVLECGFKDNTIKK